MKLSCCFFLLIVVIINNSHEVCLLKNVEKQIWTYDPVQKYIECHNETIETITQDFYKNVTNLTNASAIKLLEISNVDNVKLKTGVFDSLSLIRTLKINGGNIEIIEPEAFTGLTSLDELQFRYNKLRKLPAKCFGDLKLVEADLSFNCVDNIDNNAFHAFSVILTFNISHNSLTKLTKKVFKSLIVFNLDLSYNRISQLDEKVFENLNYLQNLYLQHNHLTLIDETVFANNNWLRNLDISYNFLKVLNISFSNSLNAAKITNNNIKSIQFFNFTEMEILDLSNNAITLSDTSFDNLAVKELVLGNNLIGKSSTLIFFSKLTSLIKISLNNNQISVLDEYMFTNCTQLKEVNLANNYLHHLIKFPVNLRNLNLRNNSLDSSITLNYLVKLEFLDLSFNNIKIIYHHFFKNLKNLQSLKLQNNRIHKITIGCFRNTKLLSELNLSNNNLKYFEIGTFAGLDNLISIDIAYNKLNVLKDNIFHNLKNLRIINAAYNNISFINFENTFLHMSYLSEINLAGNQLSCSSLAQLIIDFNRTILTKGSNHNVTNVNGIACQKSNIDTSNLNQIPKPIYKFMNKIKSNQRTANNLIIILVTVIIIKVVVTFFTTCLKPAKKFFKNF